MAGRQPTHSNEISGLAALQAALANPKCRFNDGEEGSATERLRGREPVDIHCVPKFKLSSADSIFAMGSCFARNVEYALIDAGVRVLPEKWDFPPELLIPDAELRFNIAEGIHRHVILRSVLNKYTPLSMLNEFQRVLEPEAHHVVQKGLIHIEEDGWLDPLAKDTGLLGLRESLIVRYMVDEASKSMRSASAIFLTLGLTETWLETETGMALNVAPLLPLIRRMPDRFRFFNATYSDTVDALERIFDLVTTHIRPDMKFIVTVSPVPMNTTFTQKDIITANTYSKSTLRAAAETFCERHDTVDYFPAYEMVTSTHPDVAWETDRMHVPQALVETIIDRFVTEYFTDLAPRSVAAPHAASV